MSPEILKVGDRVRLKSWDEMMDAYGPDYPENNSEDIKISWVEGSPHSYYSKANAAYCGTVVTITKVRMYEGAAQPLAEYEVDVPHLAPGCRMSMGGRMLIVSAMISVVLP